MKNVWLVFKRDILRLLKVPPALMVILFLIVLPSIYTWYNVAGFGIYDNTSAMRVRGERRCAGELRSCEERSMSVRRW